MRASKLLRDLMRPDTKDQIAERIRHRASCEQAHSETLAKFGAITAENALEAIRWQEQRIQELDKEAVCIS